MGTMNPTQTVLIADLRLDLEESNKIYIYIIQKKKILFPLTQITQTNAHARML